MTTTTDNLPPPDFVVIRPKADANHPCNGRWQIVDKERADYLMREYPHRYERHDLVKSERLAAPSPASAPAAEVEFEDNAALDEKIPEIREWLQREQAVYLSRQSVRKLVIASQVTRPASPAPAQGAGGAGATECAASGAGHSYGPHGPKGSRQCEWCGDAPAPEHVKADELDAALFHVDDHIARMHGDDRGAFEPVNVLRRGIAALRAQAATQARPSAEDVRDAGRVRDDGPLAAAIHWPQCWDTAAYPTARHALEEVYEHFRCITCRPDEPQVTDAERMAWLLPNLHPANFGMEFPGGYEWEDEVDYLRKWRAAIDAAMAATPPAAQAPDRPAGCTHMRAHGCGKDGPCHYPHCAPPAAQGKQGEKGVA